MADDSQRTSENLPSDIGASAEAFRAAQQLTENGGAPTDQDYVPPSSGGEESRDMHMADVLAEQATLSAQQAIPTPVAAVSNIASPAPAAPSPLPTQQQPPQTSSAASPHPGRSSGTPMRNTAVSGADLNGSGGSRSASVHPDSVQGTGSGALAMPAEAAVHGAPVRQYINSKITGVLLEGMKLVAKEQPKDPLRVLGEFFLQRSKELEGTGPQSS
ncbi:hypothetical protein VTK73DRAFT_9404 [Phialemonium thermophilum]|uniref:Uncharacterized protein n=1 Tax=Phialemonium thermophilum TaxID=223376 RepID=A0ABR3XL07_9PEZI